MSRASLAAFFLMLAGCPWVGDAAYTEHVRDADGDGGIGDRFDGPDCQDGSGSIANCDADGDGFLAAAVGGDDCDDSSGAVYPGAPERCDLVDNDCDGAIDNDDDDATSEAVLHADEDGDGDGDPGRVFVCQEYLDPANPNSGIHVGNARDCDDSDPSVRTGADELCDGIDNNCDGIIDDVGIWFSDADGDGWGDPTSQTSGPCVLPPGTALASDEGDCDDSDPAISPGATEVPYDDVDDNCNGNLDNWDPDFDGHVPADYWAAAQAENSQLPPGEQWEIFPGDCDDTNPARFVGNPEVCDGVDNDCDEAIDTADLAGAAELDELTLRAQVLDVYEDRDGDGFFGTEVTLCPAQVDPIIHSTVQDDCYDSGSTPGFGVLPPESIHPAAMEQCDGVDNNCDGRADWDFSSFTGSGAYFLDLDEDLFGDLAIEACGPVAGIAVAGGDCNEADPETWPGATEICGDTIRQDCSSNSIWDCDGDGQEGDYFGNGTGEDCDDDDDAVFQTSAPGGEICDGIDNDCDGLIDSADLDNLDAGILPFWYPDLDGDGWGTTVPSPGQACDSPGANFAPQDGDCNDADDAISPDGVEICNGVDDNCDLLIPNDVVAGEIDDDGDGFSECQGDLDDTNASIFPGGGGSLTWYPDLDGDGYGDELLGVPGASAPTTNHILIGGDCDDTLVLVHPGIGHELCDGIDNNCDGATITDGTTTSFDVSNPLLGTPLVGNAVPYAPDIDHNGNFSLAAVVFGCENLGPTVAMTAPEQDLIPIPLIALYGNPAVYSYTDCDDGNGAGTLYLADDDNDGVPGEAEVLADFLLDCTTTYAGPFEEYLGVTDCAPSDPTQWAELGVGEYGDVDGDGHIASISTVGACVGAVDTVPGPDCNDDDFDPDAGHSNQELFIDSGAAFESALQNCTDAELRLDIPSALGIGDPISFDSVVSVTPYARLVLRGNGGTCDTGDSTGCLGGDITLPLGIDLTFEQIGLNGEVAYTGGDTARITLTDSVMVDPASFLLTDVELRVEGTQVNSVDLIPFDLFNADAEFDAVDFLATLAVEIGINMDVDSELRVRSSTFSDLEPAIRTLGSVELDDVSFLSGKGIEALSGATVYGQNVLFSTTDRPLMVTENSTVLCTGCTIQDPGASNSIFIDPNGAPVGPSVHFDNGTITVFTGSVPLFETLSGPSHIELDGMTISTDRTLIATHGIAEVYSSTIAGSSSDIPLFKTLGPSTLFAVDDGVVTSHGGVVFDGTLRGQVTADTLQVEARALLLSNAANVDLSNISIGMNTRVAPVLDVTGGVLDVEDMIFEGVFTPGPHEPFLIARSGAEVSLHEVDARLSGGIEVDSQATVHIVDSVLEEVQSTTPIRVVDGDLTMDRVRVMIDGPGYNTAIFVGAGSVARLRSSLIWAGPATTFTGNKSVLNFGTLDLGATTFHNSVPTSQIHIEGQFAEFTAVNSLLSVPGLMAGACAFSFDDGADGDGVFVANTWIDDLVALSSGPCPAVPIHTSNLGSLMDGAPNFDTNHVSQNPAIRPFYGELAN